MGLQQQRQTPPGTWRDDHNDDRDHRKVRPVKLATAGAALLCLVGCASTPSRSVTPPAANRPTETTSDAMSVTARLVAEVPTAKATIVYTASNDPNFLLGRPTGYTSKVAFSDTRVPPGPAVAGDTGGSVDLGGSVEVWRTPVAATQRSQYILRLEQRAPLLGSEYDYLSGPILLRVSGKLTPAQAGEYRTAFAAVTGKQVEDGSPS